MVSCLAGNFGGRDELTGSLTDFGTSSLDVKANQGVAESKVRGQCGSVCSTVCEIALSQTTECCTGEFHLSSFSAYRILGDRITA
jgi:hypothetical protein